MTSALVARDLGALFDDAALFPPGSAPMEVAVTTHLKRRRTPAAAFVGPLLVPHARLREFGEVVDTISRAIAVDLDAEPLAINLITAELTHQIATDIAHLAPRVTVRAVELKVSSRGAAKDAERLSEDVPVSSYLEFPLVDFGAEDARLLVDRGVRAKFRLGGPTKADFPTSAALARVLMVCTSAGVPFKLTAGLHQPIRHCDARDGLVHHGFLNVVAATCAALRHEALPSIVGLLESTEWEVVTSRVDDALPWRSSFESMGTCSVREPLEGLHGLGLLEDAHIQGRGEL